MKRRASHLPRTASEQFQKAWDEMDAWRAEKEIDQERVATDNKFQRSTWFEYQRKGTIPFDLWERIAAYLGVKLQVSVITPMSDRAGTSRAQGAPMPDYLLSILRELEKLPDAQRPIAAGLAVAAIREEVKSHPFDEPVAERKKASRGRSSES